MGLLPWDPAEAARLPEAVYARKADAANTPAFGVACLWEPVLETSEPQREPGIEPGLFRQSRLGADHREVAAAGEFVVAVSRPPPLRAADCATAPRGRPVRSVG